MLSLKQNPRAESHRGDINPNPPELLESYLDEPLHVILQCAQRQTNCVERTAELSYNPARFRPTRSSRDSGVRDRFTCDDETR